MVSSLRFLASGPYALLQRPESRCDSRAICAGADFLVGEQAGRRQRQYNQRNGNRAHDHSGSLSWSSPVPHSALKEIAADFLRPAAVFAPDHGFGAFGEVLSLFDLGLHVRQSRGQPAGIEVEHREQAEPPALSGCILVGPRETLAADRIEAGVRCDVPAPGRPGQIGLWSINSDTRPIEQHKPEKNHTTVLLCSTRTAWRTCPSVGA